MRNRKDVIDAHSTLVRENARDLGLRHTRAARNLSPAQILSIGVIAQNLSDGSREPQLVIHVVNMSNGKTVSQVESCPCADDRVSRGMGAALYMSETHPASTDIETACLSEGRHSARASSVSASGAPALSPTRRCSASAATAEPAMPSTLHMAQKSVTVHIAVPEKIL